jgi:hypothetical protein
VQEVVQTLTYLHTDGSTATPAVTPIDSAQSSGSAGGVAGQQRARRRRSQRSARIQDDEGRSGSGHGRVP